MNETGQRIISGVTLVGMYIVAFNVNWYYNVTMFGVLLLFVFLTLYEYISLTDRGEEGRPFTIPLYVFGLGMIFFSYATLVSHQIKATAEPGPVFGLPANFWHNMALSYNLSNGVSYLLLIIIFVVQIFGRPLMGAVYSLGATILGLTYIAFFASHFLLLLTLPGGVFLIWYVSSINFITDTAAYFGGRLFGRHPVGFKISPNKTYEGYVSGLLVATGGGYLTWYLYGQITGQSLPISEWEAVLVAPLFSMLAVVGDLIESGIKRDARTKDSASLIPGHGGVFDLTDALYVNIPSMYYYIVLRDFLAGL